MTHVPLSFAVPFGVMVIWYWRLTRRNDCLYLIMLILRLRQWNLNVSRLSSDARNPPSASLLRVFQSAATLQFSTSTSYLAYHWLWMNIHQGLVEKQLRKRFQDEQWMVECIELANRLNNHHETEFDSSSRTKYQLPNLKLVLPCLCFLEFCKFISLVCWWWLWFCIITLILQARNDLGPKPSRIWGSISNEMSSTTTESDSVDI